MVHRDLTGLAALPRMSQPMVAHALPRMSQPMVAHAVRAVFDHRSSFINDP